MKRKAIWALGATLLSVFVVLFWLQYAYYNRVMSLRKEQTRQLTKNALSEVVHDIELRELVRYINQELHQPSAPNSSLVAALRQLSAKREEAEETGATEMFATRPLDRLLRSEGLFHALDTLAVSDAMLRAFFADRNALDEYVLRNLYRVYEHDSIPQLVNHRYLQERLKYRLEAKGVTEAYSMALCDARGRVLYEHSDPRMLRQPYSVDNVVIQRLFMNASYPNKLTPFIRLTLDFSDNELEMLRFALPGVISTLFVLGLGIFSLIMMIRQLTFQSTKTSFINNMTHELKTPVSSIALATQMLKDSRTGDNPEKRKQFLAIIDQEAMRMKHLIDKVLQISLFDGRVNDIALSVLDINETLLQAAEVYSVHAEKLGGSLRLELNAENTWVNANQTHLTNIFYNLLDNAVKYRDPSHTLELGIYTENVDGYIVIRIEDNGIGIPKESLKKVFERYYRVPTGLRHDVKGFGLGLAYVHSVVKQFGGRIVAEPRAGGGTSMVVRLPIHEEE